MVLLFSPESQQTRFIFVLIFSEFFIEINFQALVRLLVVLHILCGCLVLVSKMSIVEKIAQIEAEMAKTQRNKATMGHLGLLKARLAKLRRELITPKGGGGGPGEGFDVAKTGDARIGFVGKL